MMVLQIGDNIPAFNLPDKEGDFLDSTKVVGQKPVVIYFYPKDFTPGCRKEACQFRDAYRDFKKYGAEVIGISSDSTDSHQAFSDRYQLPFILLSDTFGRVRQKFGVRKHLLRLLPGRATFVADQNGILRFKFHQLRPSDHVQNALDIVKGL